jgi:hypothetical protein
LALLGSGFIAYFSQFSNFSAILNKAGGALGSLGNLFMSFMNQLGVSIQGMIMDVDLKLRTSPLTANLYNEVNPLDKSGRGFVNNMLGAGAKGFNDFAFNTNMNAEERNKRTQLQSLINEYNYNKGLQTAGLGNQENVKSSINAILSLRTKWESTNDKSGVRAFESKRSQLEGAIPETMVKTAQSTEKLGDATNKASLFVKDFGMDVQALSDAYKKATQKINSATADINTQPRPYNPLNQPTTTTRPVQSRFSGIMPFTSGYSF